MWVSRRCDLIFTSFILLLSTVATKSLVIGKTVGAFIVCVVAPPRGQPLVVAGTYANRSECVTYSLITLLIN